MQDFDFINVHIINPCINKAITESLRKKFVTAGGEYLEFVMKDLHSSYRQKLLDENRCYQFPNYADLTSSKKVCGDDKYSKKMYHELALKFHPDINPNGLEIFQQIQDLYENQKIDKLHQLYKKHILNNENINEKTHDMNPKLSEKDLWELMNGSSYLNYLNINVCCDNYITREKLLKELEYEKNHLERMLEIYKSTSDKFVYQNKLEIIKHYINNPDLCKSL